jgi:hypothetical protein
MVHSEVGFMVTTRILVRGFDLHFERDDRNWLVVANRTVRIPLKGSLDAAQILDGSWRSLSPTEEASFVTQRSLLDQIESLRGEIDTLTTTLAPFIAARDAWKADKTARREMLSQQRESVGQRISARRDEVAAETERYNESVQREWQRLHDLSLKLKEQSRTARQHARDLRPAIRTADKQNDQATVRTLEQKQRGFEAEEQRLDRESETTKGQADRARAQRRSVSDARDADPELKNLLALKEQLREAFSALADEEFPESHALAEIEEAIAACRSSIAARYVELLGEALKLGKEGYRTVVLKWHSSLEAEAGLTVIDGLLSSYGPIVFDKSLRFDCVISSPADLSGGITLSGIVWF